MLICMGVQTGSAVLARRRCTLVDIFCAVASCKSKRTVAVVGITPVSARPAVLARPRFALVDIHLTVRSVVSSSATAIICVVGSGIGTNPAVLTRTGLALINICAAHRWRAAILIFPGATIAGVGEAPLRSESGNAVHRTFRSQSTAAILAKGIFIVSCEVFGHVTTR